jgi:hypothetical protein
MTGRRLQDGIDWSTITPDGSYWRGEDGRWYATTPNGLLAGLANHDVIEHDDGTITVSPSILVKQPNVGQWHGFLERGVWREC